METLLHKTARWVVDIVAVLYLAAFVIYGFTAQVRMSGQSMMPLIRSDDVVFVNRILYHFAPLGRFDVVAFYRDDEKANLKRVIGLPGETVQIRDGGIYIDGVLLAEGEWGQAVSLSGVAAEPVKLGPDEYFVLGDNREGSEDSRFDSIGNVGRSQIIGKVWLRVYPFIDAGLIE
ncbi:MAG: signal peptidase I [Lachnospiraceae bacterium]|nr:signal peptidase I [Lachnospiraceae bacterium]